MNEPDIRERPTRRPMRASEAVDREPAPHPTGHVHAGQVAAHAEPAVLATVLGSCVAVCLWDPRSGVGGMNHYMLPLALGASVGSPRFGAVANDLLLTCLLDRGASPRGLRAKVFGGACVMPTAGAPADHLGRKNVELALAFLAQRGIALVASDVGGNRGRKLVFRTNDGAAWIRSI